MSQCATTPPRDGLFVVDGKRQVIYAKINLSLRDRLRAARKLTDTSG